MIPSPTCRHLHTTGRPCGSPALRGEPFCFHHHTVRKPMPRRDHDGSAVPQLPAPDDFLAIQRGIGEVLRLLAVDRLTDRRAQTLLNGLAKASINLARHLRQEEQLAAQSLATPPVTAFVNHPTHGTLAPDPEADPNQINNIADPTTPETPETTSPDATQPGPVWPAPQPRHNPDPIPRITPDRSHTTSYDEGKLYEMRERFVAIYTQYRHDFEARKEAELASLYEDRYTQREAELEARFERHPPTPNPRLQLPAPIPIPPQQNQDLTIKQEHPLALAS